MATRTFLNSADFEKAQTLLLPPLELPTSEMWETLVFPSKDFSTWLSLNIEAQLMASPYWLKAQPIAIGSWGRGELAPQSDLDVVFCGDAKSVEDLLEDLKDKGIDLKYRYPKNTENWALDTNVFEVNALFSGHPFTKEAASALQNQKKRILLKRKSFRRQLLKEFILERRKRNHRYDSIANYLEPNIKFGPGGLRDIQQALMIADWYSDVLVDHRSILSALEKIKGYFLTLRQKMHLMGYSDVLVAQAQKELALWFGYKSHSSFMQELQKILFKVSFYCDLIFEICSLNKKVEIVHFKTSKSAIEALKESPSLATQWSLSEKRQDLLYSSDFKKVFTLEAQDLTIEALFRTRMLSQVLPAFKAIEGLVQHDQYHRYTVDAHILQAIRKVRQAYQKPSTLGKFKVLTKNFKELDWQILLWTALYHDMGKGREKDHSVEGQGLVEKEFALLGLSKALQVETAWMVEQHLLLSLAAFRQDPHSPEVWKMLADKGAQGERLRRLAVFTAMDIQATNPDAWTSWKEKLLLGLVQAMERPQTSRFLEFQQKFVKHNISDHILRDLDSGLLNSISSAQLVKDVKKVESLKERQIDFIKGVDGLWVRFFDPVDRDGLFLEYVTRLWQAGVVIDHAYVHTISGWGVYDWFQVRSPLKPALLHKMICQNIKNTKVETQLKVLDVALVSESQQEWVISFRGLDKKGVLLLAAQCLHALGLQIRWAKIHTWGRQIEDIFAVVPAQSRSASEWTQELKNRLIGG